MTGTDDAELLAAEFLRALRTAGAAVQRFHLHEEGGHHIAGRLIQQQAEEIAAFNLLRGIEIDTGRINHTGKDGVLCRHQVLGLDHNIGGAKEGQPLVGFLFGAAAGHFVAFAIPGLLNAALSVGILLDPRLGLGVHIRFIIGQGINQALLQGFIRLQASALANQANRFLHTQQVGHTHNTAGTRHQTDHRLWQAHLNAFDGHAIVTRQGDFKTATQRRAIHTHRYGHTQGFQGTQWRFGRHNAVVHFFFLIGRWIQIHLQHLFDVATSKELVGLATAQINTGDAASLDHTLQFCHGCAHGLVVFQAHGIYSFTRLIKDQFNDAVCVFL